jgi:hypothetical protein
MKRFFSEHRDLAIDCMIGYLVALAIITLIWG